MGCKPTTPATWTCVLPTDLLRQLSLCGVYIASNHFARQTLIPKAFRENSSLITTGVSGHCSCRASPFTSYHSFNIHSQITIVEERLRTPLGCPPGPSRQYMHSACKVMGYVGLGICQIVWAIELWQSGSPQAKGRIWVFG